MSTDRDTDTQTDRRHAKNEFFGISIPQNVEIHQNLEIDFLDQCNTGTFSVLRIVEKVKIKRITSASFLDMLVLQVTKGTVAEAAKERSTQSSDEQYPIPT